MNDYLKHPDAKALMRGDDDDPYGVAPAPVSGEPDSTRLDEIERACAKGATFSFSWYPREKSTMEESISYDVPAGYYWNDDVDGGPYPTLRAAIDAALAARASGSSDRE